MIRSFAVILILSFLFGSIEKVEKPISLFEYLEESFIETDLLYLEDEKIYMPVISSTSQYPTREKINERLKEIFYHQVKTDSFQTKLKRDLHESITNYIAVYGNVKDTSKYFKKNELIPTLSGKDCSLIRCNGNTLAFLVSFDYEAEIENHSEQYGTELFENTYFEIYYFNLLDGGQINIKDLFKQSSIDELNNFIIAKANEKVKSEYDFSNEIEKKEFLYQYQYDEEFENIMVDSTIERKVIEFDIRKHGVLIPRYFSFQLYIPKLSAPTLSILGKGVPIRITFEEMEKFLNPDGPLGNLKKFTSTPKTDLRKINNPPFNDLYDVERNGFKISYNRHDDKILEETIYNESRDLHSKTYNTRRWLDMKIQRLENGLIERIVTSGFDKKNGSGDVKGHSFHYDSNMNLNRVDSGKDFTIYKYDEFQNLIYSKTVGDHSFEDFYKYYRDFCIRERYDNGFDFNVKRDIFKFDNNHTITHEYSGENLLYEYLYQFNGRGQKIAKLYNYYGEEKTYRIDSWSYDKKGKLTEHCYDDLHIWYYTYDESGNLVKKVNVKWGVVYPDGIEYHYKYDEKDRLIYVDAPNESVGDRRVTKEIVYTEK